MPTSAGNIAKGEILEEFDKYINDAYDPKNKQPLKDKATAVKNMLTGGADLLDVIVNSGIPLSSDQKNHLSCDWLDKPQPDGAKSGWWQYLQPLDPVLRQGFIESAKAVESTGKRVDHYWVSGGSILEMWVCEGPDQITTLIATPTPPSGPGAVGTGQDLISIIRSVAVLGAETVDGVLKQGNSVIVVHPKRQL